MLDPGAAIARPPGRVALGVAPDGTATVAWSQAVGKPVSYPIRAATTVAANNFAPVTRFAPSGSVHDLATGPGGTTLVVWGQIDPSLSVARFDPVTGQPSIVWTARNAGAAPGVRLATRPAAAARSTRSTGSSHTLCHRGA